jgi:hypothetical protein
VQLDAVRLLIREQSMRIALRVAALTFAALVASLGTSYAWGGPQLVSGADPYANCTFGAGQGDTSFPSDEVEPFIATNPTNPSNVLGAWQQDRWTDGGSRGLVAGVSFDGGHHFQQTTLPFSTCAPGGVNFSRASDAGVAFDQTGLAYSLAVVFNGPFGTCIPNGIAEARSFDGGRTWKDTRIISSNVGTGPNCNPTDDKPLIFADPTRPRTAYAVWDRFIDVPGTAATASTIERAISTRSGHAVTAAAAPAQASPAMLSVTHDGGAHWSAPQVIVQAGANEFTDGNSLVIDPRSGTLYDFDVLTTADGVDHLNYVRSDDGGQTWSPRNIIRAIVRAEPNDPITGAPVRGGEESLQAINPVTGQLYDTWEDPTPSGGLFDQVEMITSFDQGQTWSQPQIVSTATGRPAFMPTLAVAPDGRVGLTYYDYRNLAAGNTTTLPTDLWFKSSTPGPLHFGPDVHVAGSFDMLVAPEVDTRGHFIGDYQGTTVVNGKFRPLFVQANSSGAANDPTDVFTAGPF